MKEKVIKPNKKSFFFSRFLWPAIILLVIFIIAFTVIRRVLNSPLANFLAIIILFFILILRFVSTTISYKKEKYVFSEKKVIHKLGGIFSENETELNIKKITHVSLTIPFIENKLFQTGKVDIEAAGSGRTEIILTNIDNPDQIYDFVKDMMKENGFGLKMKEKIISVTPNLFAAFIETGRTFLAQISSIFFIGIYLYFAVLSENSILSNLGISSTFVGVLAFLTLGGVIAGAIIHFLNLSKREYELFNDTIRYSEGFLTKNYSFVPIENLADTTVTQTFIDKVFGLYDISISCQGSKQEILFKNIVRGDKFEYELDALMEKTELKDISQGIEVSKKEEKPSKKVPGFKARYKQEIKRVLFVPFSFALITLLLIFSLSFVLSSSLNNLLPENIVVMVFIALGIALLFFVIFGLSYLIAALTTNYELTHEAVKEKFDFITSRHKEFSLDKITGIVINESLVDKLFNTVSIDFWSIGSAEHITFKYVKKSEELYTNVLKISGMQNKEKIYSIPTKFSFGRMLKSGLIVYIFVFLYLITSLFLAFINSWFIILSIFNFSILFLIYFFQKLYYKDSSLEFYPGHIKCELGWFVRRKYFALYKHIQDIKTVKYPLTSLGKVVFNVSGHHGPAQRTSESRTDSLNISNHIKLGYISDIREKHTLFDLILYDVKYANYADKILQDIEKYEHEVTMKVKQSVANTIFLTILVSSFTILTIPLLPLIIPTVYVYINSKNYYITNYRVFVDYGVIYKKKISVLFRKIDHLNTERNFINKMFNNGTIIVNTRGSDKPELVVRNIEKYDAFFKELEKSYSN